MENEEWLGQIWSNLNGTAEWGWRDYARGTEEQSRAWQAQDPTKRRVVDWIYKERVLVPPTRYLTLGQLIFELQEVMSRWGDESWNDNEVVTLQGLHIVSVNVSEDELADDATTARVYLTLEEQ